MSLWNTFPPEIIHGAEEHSFLPTCDLGHCNGDTQGWAFDLEFANWLTGCTPCLLRAAKDGISVVWLAEVLAVLDRIPTSTETHRSD